jgi:hypothetical protein
MVSGPGGAGLSYDPTGRLNRTSLGSAVTRFGYDGTNLIGEFSAAGALLRRYVHGPGTWHELPTSLGSARHSCTGIGIIGIGWWRRAGLWLGVDRRRGRGSNS